MKNKTYVSYVEKITDKDQIEIIQSYKGKNFKEYRDQYNASLKYDDKYKFRLSINSDVRNVIDATKCIMCYTIIIKKLNQLTSIS